jgi:hypothetical protein
MLLLEIVPLPQTSFAGDLTVLTQQQWEQRQRKEQLIRARFDKLIQQARAQQELITAWHRKARLREAKLGSQKIASIGQGRRVAVAASR